MQAWLDHLQWAHQLRALVVNKDQAAYWALLRKEAHNYGTVKVAMLYRLEILLKSYRKAFRARKAKDAKRPHSLLSYLRDALNKWLPGNWFNWEGVIDQVLLEHFLWDLEDETQTWVK